MPRTRLTSKEIQALDPYQLMGELGKRIIHPGGRRSTEELFERARLARGERVLEVGCGTGTTAVEMARRFGVHVTAVDIDPRMLDQARETVQTARMEEQVRVEEGDILDLAYEDGSFDKIIIEAVTMFVDRPQAAKEVHRVVRPGGRVLDHEFVWRKEPTARAREAMEDEVCPGIRFDTEADWNRLYAGAGFVDIESVTGPFAMMTPAGFLRDEGFRGTMAFMGRTLSRWAYLRRMGWLMRRIGPAIGSLGYVVVAADKPE